VHSTLEDAMNYSIVTGLRGKALNVESVEMQSLVLYIKSLGGKGAANPGKAPVNP
jgi:cytochrome c